MTPCPSPLTSLHESTHRSCNGSGRLDKGRTVLLNLSPQCRPVLFMTANIPSHSNSSRCHRYTPNDDESVRGYQQCTGQKDGIRYRTWCPGNTSTNSRSNCSASGRIIWVLADSVRNVLGKRNSPVPTALKQRPRGWSAMHPEMRMAFDRVWMCLIVPHFQQLPNVLTFTACVGSGHCSTHHEFSFVEQRRFRGYSTFERLYHVRSRGCLLSSTTSGVEYHSALDFFF